MTTPLEAIKAARDDLRSQRVQRRYDELMAEGKHGHYETMFRVVEEETARTAHALLSQVEAAQVPSVEEVARVIDPRAFESLGVLRGFAGFEATRKKEQTNALEKATAILALFKGEKK